MIPFSPGDGPLPQAEPRLGPEGRHHMQRRAARRAVEGPPQGLAIDGDDPGPIGPEVAQERLEGPPEGLRVQKPEHPAEPVMARQAILRIEKLPQKHHPVLGELGKVHTAFRAAHRSHKGNRQDVEKVMPLRVPGPGIGQVPEDRDQHAVPERGVGSG